MAAQMPAWWREQTLMERLDYLAETDPSHVFGAYPFSPTTYDQGFREVTYSQLAKAVDRIAWLIKGELGPDVENETLAYVGSNDVRYVAVILGAAKAGHKALLISPRNSLAAQSHLFEATKCMTIIVPSPQPPPVTTILEAHDLKRIDIPTVEHLLNPDVSPFPYSKPWGEAKNDALFAAHTSGSTGMPKPLVWPHHFATSCIEHSHFSAPQGYESQGQWLQGTRVLLTFPPFHAAFIGCGLYNGLAHGTTTVAPTSGAIATGQGLVEALKQTKIDTAFLVPSIVLDLAQSPTLLETVAQNVDCIVYCGGDLPQAIGNAVAAKIPLYNQYGASEMGFVPQISGNRTPDDWKYIQPHPKAGVEFRLLSADMYEYTVVRAPSGQIQPAAFSLFPDLEEYGSRDLYVQHPKNPKLWKWQARVDDVIVFLNGEKTNPISMEQHIPSQNPEVARALVVGSQRFQAALIVQPAAAARGLSVTERAHLVETIWPSIEDANRVCPAHARIAKSHILFADPRKPMLITGKGTIQRAGTVKLYEAELDRLYVDADAASATDTADTSKIFDFTDVAAISDVIVYTLKETANLKALAADDNFFSLGMDSLQALLTLRRLRQTFGLADLALTTLYINPTAESLAKAVCSEARKGPANSGIGETIAVAQRLLDKFVSVINSLPHEAPRPVRAPDGLAIVLTGSTGALGCHLLDSLLSNPSVSAIHCFNRAADGGKSLQLSRLRSRGLSSSLAADERLSFHHVDLTKPDLALAAKIHAKLQDTITHIIHAAWPVDFNMALHSFEPQLEGLVNLISFAATSAQRIRYMFVSSVSSAMRSQSEPIKETVLRDFNHLNSIGYGQSKLVAEILLAHAGDRISKSSVEFAFARVGQLAGTIKGTQNHDQDVVTWKAAEWFPSLVISSVCVGALPSSLGVMNRIDWVPIDVAADVLVELTVLSPSDHDSQIGVFQPDNQQAKRWNELRESVIAAVKDITGKKLDVVSPKDWLEKVQASMESSVERSGIGMAKAIDDRSLEKLLTLNPAVKLLDMFKNTLPKDPLAPRESTAAAKASKALTALGAIQDDWMRRWIGEWLQSIRNA